MKAKLVRETLNESDAYFRDDISGGPQTTEEREKFKDNAMGHPDFYQITDAIENGVISEYIGSDIGKFEGVKCKLIDARAHKQGVELFIHEAGPGSHDHRFKYITNQNIWIDNWDTDPSPDASQVIKSEMVDDILLEVLNSIADDISGGNETPSVKPTEPEPESNKSNPFIWW